ncbi:MAG TPA: hypothetical protein VFK44_02805 [Bacillales bacterium]|nr:hypothetical protein [Bacillales bacterium]
MAFGIKREELQEWKRQAARGEIAFLTHYWIHPRFPECKTVTKAGCADVERLMAWGRKYGLEPAWIDHREDYPHFDLIGERQREILKQEGLTEQLERFGLKAERDEKS